MCDAPLSTLSRQQIRQTLITSSHRPLCLYSLIMSPVPKETIKHRTFFMPTPLSNDQNVMHLQTVYKTLHRQPAVTWVVKRQSKRLYRTVWTLLHRSSIWKLKVWKLSDCTTVAYFKLFFIILYYHYFLCFPLNILAAQNKHFLLKRKKYGIAYTLLDALVAASKCTSIAEIYFKNI